MAKQKQPRFALSGGSPQKKSTRGQGHWQSVRSKKHQKKTSDTSPVCDDEVIADMPPQLQNYTHLAQFAARKAGTLDSKRLFQDDRKPSPNEEQERDSTPPHNSCKSGYLKSAKENNRDKKQEAIME
jgi:hypothetical protein